MRISDWSSDVCSSDLVTISQTQNFIPTAEDPSNEATVTQEGVDGDLTILQEGDNIASVTQDSGSVDDDAFIAQFGDDNSADLTQSGDSQATGILQVGSTNTATVSQTGAGTDPAVPTVEDVLAGAADGAGIAPLGNGNKIGRAACRERVGQYV